MTESSSAARNLLIAFDLHEAGVAMMKQNLRRKYPDASADEIDERLRVWLQEHPLLGVPFSELDHPDRPGRERDSAEP